MAKNGVAIERQYVTVIDDGSVVIDWGNGRLQDMLTGKFKAVPEEEPCTPVQDHELDRLVAAGRVETYNWRTVFVLALPEDLQEKAVES